MNHLELVKKSERIVRAMLELGVLPNTEVLEDVPLSLFTETNLNQLDTEGTKEDLKVEYEFLDIEILDRIIKESKEAMLKIIERAYGAYNEPSLEPITI